MERKIQMGKKIEMMDDTANPSVEAERRKNLDFRIAFLHEKLRVNENALLDIPNERTTSAGIMDKFRQAREISEQLQWLNQIKMHRYLVPEEQEKQKQATALKEEDAKRITDGPAEGEGGKLIVMP